MNKICEACGNPFSYEPNPNYPDKRKYCDTCSANKKAQWEAKQNAPVEKMQAPNQDGFIPMTMKPSTNDEIRAAVAVKGAIELAAIRPNIQIADEAKLLYSLLKELANE